MLTFSLMVTMVAEFCSLVILKWPKCVSEILHMSYITDQPIFVTGYFFFTLISLKVTISLDMYVVFDVDRPYYSNPYIHSTVHSTTVLCDILTSMHNLSSKYL